MDGAGLEIEEKQRGGQDVALAKRGKEQKKGKCKRVRTKDRGE